MQRLVAWRAGTKQSLGPSRNFILTIRVGLSNSWETGPGRDSDRAEWRLTGRVGGDHTRRAGIIDRVGTGILGSSSRFSRLDMWEILQDRAAGTSPRAFVRRTEPRDALPGNHDANSRQQYNHGDGRKTGRDYIVLQFIGQFFDGTRHNIIKGHRGGGLNFDHFSIKI